MSTSEIAEDLSFEPYNLRVGERLLTRDGAPVELGARAFDILTLLVSRPNEVISKKELLSHVWPDVTVEESSLRFHMASLRKALGDGKDGARYITTLAGRGYCFVAPVTRSRDEVEAAKPVAAEFPHANLPGRIMHMVGREEDVLRISTHVMATRFVSIVGSGGVGKTTVAIAVGHHLREAFKGAVLAVDLSMLSDPGLVATAIASMLGLSVQSEDATPALIAHLRTMRMLLILDTCEHLTDAVAALASQIYAKTPDVHILATSREVLQVEGELVYRLDTLAYPPEASEVLSSAAQTFPAPRLFIERAAASGARLELTDADVAVIVRICRKLDGVALAIELAARRVETYGLHQTENLLDQHLALLLLGHRSVTPRQRTLQATLDWSYQLLTEAERIVLRRLRVFVGHFALDAALAVVTVGNVDQSQALGAIESLVGKSMIATRPVGAMMRYRLLDTTRVYVLSIAVDDDEAAELAARHATYYRRWLEQSGSAWPTLSTGVERSFHFDALNDARRALEWCFGPKGDVEIGVQLAAAAAPVFLVMSLLPECRRWSERALLALDGANCSGPEEMQLQAALGVSLMFTRGASDTARRALSRSLAIAEARRDRPAQVGVLSALVQFHQRKADFRAALQYARRSQELVGSIEEPDAIALAQLVLGISLHFVGDFSDARTQLEAALKHCSGKQRTYLGFDDRTLVGIGLTRTLWVQGFLTQAIEQAHRTLDHAKLSSNPASLAVVLSWISGVLIWVGDLRSAEKHVDWLILHAESHSLYPYLHVGRAYKGALAICSGNAKAGIESLREGLMQLHAMHYDMRNTEFNIVLTQGLLAVGRINEALALIEETISSLEEKGELYFLPEALRVKGIALLGSPDFRDKAEASFIKSLECSRRQGALGWELRASIDLARLWVSAGKSDEGRTLLRPVLEQFTEGRDTADLQTATRLLAELGQDQ